MPNTLIPIQTYTLTSTASSVTFSNIPQNYTDLKVIVSARNSSAGNRYYLLISLNGSSASAISRVRVMGYDGGNTQTSQAADSHIGTIGGAGTTSSTFSNTEIHIPNYTRTTAYKCIGSESLYGNNSSTENTLGFWSGLWASNSAVTSIALTSDSGSFDTNSTFTLYGISNGAKATGGTTTVVGGYVYHAFTSTSSFLPNQRIKNAEVLCVAGGGGGGVGRGGGGGAGGVLYAAGQTFNAGSVYTALVGAGGVTGSAASVGVGNGTQGSSSILGSVIAIGGGLGVEGNALNRTGGTGGSGGGGGSETGVGGSGTSGQGNAGGNGSATNSGLGGGGGGAGGAGANASSDNTMGGNGGIGTSAYTAWHLATATGVLVNLMYYVGGGGGGGANASAASYGGVGGGGGGGYTNAGVGTAGSANTGGGGGGGGWNSGLGGAGGSGLIIVRYPAS